MPYFPSLCPSFFKSDPEYPDLECPELAVKRYLQLIYSADYRSKPYMDEEDRPLPANLLVIGRRLTPALRIKILRALDVYPTKYQIRIYQLFSEVKFLGYKYNYKQKIWEYQTKWKNLQPNNT